MTVFKVNRAVDGLNYCRHQNNSVLSVRDGVYLPAAETRRRVSVACVCPAKATGSKGIPG